MSRLDSRVAFITGGSSRLGSAIGLALARAGARIAVGYYSRPESAQATCRLAHEEGLEAICIGADLTDEKEIEDSFGEIADRYGCSPSILVHCVGRSRSASLLETSAKDWDEVLSANVKSLGLCSKQFVSSLACDHGDLLAICSSSFSCPLPYSPHYVASKGAVASLVRELAVELGPRIRVNAIAPGIISAPNHSDLVKRFQEELADVIPIGRPLAPDDVAELAAILLSSRTPLTGQVLILDGGIGLRSY
jgi:NAD(P)-dependent dehydrogenase (short-subunit alcohol dehydrogenase family)